MFSPETSVQASIARRNPRRRPRTSSSDDSTTLRHQPKRLRRSGLAPDTFEPLGSTRINGNLDHAAPASVLNGHAINPRAQRQASVESTSLTIRNRGLKKGEREKRSHQAEGDVILTKNDNYVVTRLHTNVEFLQNRAGAQMWRGDFSSNSGYAVITTHTHATVWRFLPGSAPSEASKPLTINLPNPSNDDQLPLPLGMVIASASEPAFLVITPATGKVMYWESLASAATADALRQKQQAVQGILHGMLSGEVITKITEAEPHGFVLTFSLGRIAHLTISDPQGKPSLNVQFLRGNGSSTGGLFSGLRNVFNSTGWCKDIAAVRAGNSAQRGQRNVLVATTKGVFQLWNLNWNGTHYLVYEADAGDDILKYLAENGQFQLGRHEQLFEVLDFTIITHEGNGHELVRNKDSNAYKVLALTHVPAENSSNYALVGLTIANGVANVDVVHPILVYTTSLAAETLFRPQVLVPGTAETAFVMFEKSVVLVSLVEAEVSPSSQLQEEAGTLPHPFQDTIDFRKDKGYRIVGCGSDVYDRDRGHTLCLLMVYGYGIVKIDALPMKEGQSARDRATVTARTKIEQAVFFGSMQQNLLDFSGRPEISFAQEEVEVAALEVNDSIMKSTSDYIPALTPSMDHLLQVRSAALTELMKHLRRYFKPLSRLARWKLLWSAEKMAAAKAVWRSYNVAMGDKRGNKTILLTEIADMLHENYKMENQPERGETDAVRHWFVHDIWRIEKIVPWAQKAIDELYTEGIRDPISQADLVSQADDLQLSALETAFRFREDNAGIYGLGSEAMSDGVLFGGYEDLPAIWTSTHETVNKVKRLVDVSRETAVRYEDTADESGLPSMQLVMKIAADNPRLVQICCQVYIERYRWLQSQPDPQSKATGQTLERDYYQVRKELIVQLSEIGLAEEGIRLAEKYRDMEALVDIIARENIEMAMRSVQAGLSESEEEGLVAREELNAQRTKTYFTKFGTGWANAFFSKHIETGKLTEMLENGANFQQPLTTFLRQNESCAKLAWVNDVLAERNYTYAAMQLISAQEQETNLWNRKIQLSISKLAALAAQNKEQLSEPSMKKGIEKCGRDMAILDIQESLYDYIKPSLRGAIDETAETELAKEQFCTRSVKGKPAFRDSLEQSMTKLVAQQVLDAKELINTLTLMDEDTLYQDPEGFAGLRFYRAFEVVRKSGLGSRDTVRATLLEHTIWRRCMIQDDWEAINRTELKDDMEVEQETSATALFKTIREGYRTGLWEESPPLNPTAVLIAGDTIEILRKSSRYAIISDSILESLARDLETEDSLLEYQIEKGRLEMWWKGIVQAVRASVEVEANRVAEELRDKERIEAESLARAEGRNRVAAWKKSHGDSVNGVSGGTSTDEQGDIIMG